MHNCRYPFMCSTTACEKCAAPVYEIPPETEFLRTRFAMICVTFAALVVLAVVAFTVPNAFERVSSAHQEEIV